MRQCQSLGKNWKNILGHGLLYYHNTVSILFMGGEMFFVLFRFFWHLEAEGAEKGKNRRATGRERGKERETARKVDFSGRASKAEGSAEG